MLSLLCGIHMIFYESQLDIILILQTNAEKAYRKFMHLKNIAIDQKCISGIHRCCLCAASSDTFQLQCNDFELNSKKTDLDHSNSSKVEKVITKKFLLCQCINIDFRCFPYLITSFILHLNYLIILSNMHQVGLCFPQKMCENDFSGMICACCSCCCCQHNCTWQWCSLPNFFFSFLSLLVYLSLFQVPFVE